MNQPSPLRLETKHRIGGLDRFAGERALDQLCDPAFDEMRMHGARELTMSSAAVTLFAPP